MFRGKSYSGVQLPSTIVVSEKNLLRTQDCEAASQTLVIEQTSFGAQASCLYTIINYNQSFFRLHGLKFSLACGARCHYLENRFCVGERSKVRQNQVLVTFSHNGRQGLTPKCQSILPEAFGLGTWTSAGFVAVVSVFSREQSGSCRFQINCRDSEYRCLKPRLLNASALTKTLKLTPEPEETVHPTPSYPQPMQSLEAN